jgi:hypothetical protein
VGRFVFIDPPKEFCMAPKTPSPATLTRLSADIDKRIKSPVKLLDWLIGRVPFVVGPTIAYFEPLAGPRETVMTIHGSEFAAAREDNEVEVGGRACVVVSASATELRVITPPDVESGAVTVKVGTNLATGPQDFIVTGYPKGGAGEDGPPISFAGAGAGEAGDVNPIGTVRVLVALLQPNDASPANPAALRTTIADIWANVTTYYAQASYGRTTVQVDVLSNWATLDGTHDDFVAGDNIDPAQLDRLMAQAAQAAVDEGLDLDDYQMMAATFFASGTFLRAWGGWSQQNFSYDNGLSGPDHVDINLTADHQINLLAIGEIANWGRAAHEFGHNVVSAPAFTGDGTATLGEDVYGSDLVDPGAATAQLFELMGAHDMHPLFSGYHLKKLGYYNAANIAERQWDRNPFSEEFDVVAHGLSENASAGRVHLVKIRVAAGLEYYVQVRQRPGATAQIFDDSIPLGGAANQGGVIVTRVVSDTLNTNQQTRFITLAHDQEVLSQSEFAEDPARALRVTVVNAAVQARPLVCRVRVEWAQTIANDPNGAFDLSVEPWDSGYQTPDIWLDRPPFGTFDQPLDSAGRPQGNGDRPKVGALNHFHARVHNSGAMDATNVNVTFYAVTPPGVGDNGNWAPIGSSLIPSVPANDFRDAGPANWVPVVGQHTCLKVYAGQQLGEISGGNNSAQENVSDFIAAGGSPVEPVIIPTAIRNPLDERRMVHVDVRGVPQGWRVHFPHAWVWLDGKAERHFDLIVFPYLDYNVYQERKLPKDAGIKIHGDLPRSYEEPQLPAQEPPGSRLYPIGGVLNNVHIRRRSTIRLEEYRENERDEWTIALRGKVAPAAAGQRVRVQVLDPAGEPRIAEVKTDAQGSFQATFDLHYRPSLEASRRRWKKATKVIHGTYRAQAEIFDATTSADAVSNLVFITR